MASKTQVPNNNRPVIIQQKLDFPTEDIKQLLNLMQEKVKMSQETKETPLKIERNLGLFAQAAQNETVVPDLGKKDNISLAILRGLQKVGTKGLFKKIVSWAELNYREEVVSSIMTEFGMRSRNKKRAGDLNKPTQLEDDDSENDEDIINNMRNALIEEESTDYYNNKDAKFNNLFKEGNYFVLIY